jgi:urease accessory protein
VNAIATHQRAQLDLGFARRGDRTVLDRRLFSWPFVLTRTFLIDPVPSHMLTVIVQTSSGAVHGEDRLVQRLRLGEGSAAHVTTQGATAVHRANPGVTTREAVSLSVAPHAFLEYLPEPRILFPDSALNQTIDVDCVTGATAIFSDAFTLHDPEHGTRCFRQLESTTTILVDGSGPVMIDRLNITNPGRQSRHTAFGTILMVAPQQTPAFERLALELSTSLGVVAGLYAAASLLPASAGVGVRLAGRDLRSLRAGLQLSWIAFRQHLHGSPPASRRKGDEQLSGGPDKPH